MDIFVIDKFLSLMRYEPNFHRCNFSFIISSYFLLGNRYIHDLRTNEYVSCVFSLVSGKDKYLNCNLRHELIVLLEYQWMFQYITVDFEIGLINVKKENSPEALLNCSGIFLAHFSNTWMKRFDPFPPSVEIHEALMAKLIK
ncbi:hypothetical protein HZS_4777 [Henneguya salminicola]|nr:hypothetical protein HZS_4777 [Henneguya salminicola]